MAPDLTTELVVTGDVAGAALRHFLRLAPKTIALAGGSTPRAFYERLASAAYDWQRVEIFFGDERCVPADHPDSNFRMAWEALLSKVAARVHRMAGEGCDPAGYAAELESVFGEGVPRFDLMVLGLGEDGHTASLFANDPALDIKDQLVIRVDRPDHMRLSLSLPVLSAARNAMFLVQGAKKSRALGLLLTGGNIPAALVESESILLIADTAAASHLQGPSS